MARLTAHRRPWGGGGGLNSGLTNLQGMSLLNMLGRRLRKRQSYSATGAGQQHSRDEAIRICSFPLKSRQPLGSPHTLHPLGPKPFNTSTPAADGRLLDSLAPKYCKRSKPLLILANPKDARIAESAKTELEQAMCKRYRQEMREREGKEAML